jgi:Phytanoyl-CoA dioxygenase (PhyH)
MSAVAADASVGTRADFTEQVERDGFVIVPDVFDAHETAAMLEGFGSDFLQSDAAGARNILRTVPCVARLAGSARMRALATGVLGANAFAVRGIFFDKTPGANWKVAWHQDLTIAVRERRDVPGFGPWSRKAGIDHVQPPVEILRGMITLRLHLDDCDEDNGALKVIPGSHLSGRLDAAATRRTVQNRAATCCAVRTGGVLAMRPLLLHASSPACNPRHRRVIHIEYAARELPGGLAWHDHVGA